MKVIAKFVVPVQFALKYDQLKLARTKLNQHHTGKELGIQKVSKDHQESHYEVCKSYSAYLEVEVLEDGTIIATGLHKQSTVTNKEE